MVNLAEKTLAGLCLSASAEYKDKTALSLLSNEKIERKITYTQLGIFARQISCLLRKLGVNKGDRVLLAAENCPEWGITYFGIAIAGAVSVPLLTGFSGEQMHNIAEHAGVSAICVSRKVSTINNPGIPIIYIDSIVRSGTYAEITVCMNGEEKQIPLELDNFIADTKEDDLAVIIYTSGTQGNSKGVMLSGKNIISNAIYSVGFVMLYPSDRVLSILPLAHSYECTIGLAATLMCGCSITYIDKPPSPSVLLPALKLVRPTIMLTVPLLIEKIYKNWVEPKLTKSFLYKFPLTQKAAVRVAGIKLKKTFGGCIRFYGIGGAPLSAKVEEFLHQARFPYAVGYGLTEASPLVTGETPLKFKLNSGGYAYGDVSLRLFKTEYCDNENEGEVQVKGPNIMLGYYKDSGKTAEALTDDGWLRTGDLGMIDEKGRLHIKGRLKALILGPSGENIYPEEIEGLLGSSVFIEDALVYSGERGELVALVCLTDAAKAAAEKIEHILDELKTWANKKLAVFSKLSRIDVKDEPFEKTPTMKIKRYLYFR